MRLRCLVLTAGMIGAAFSGCVAPSSSRSGFKANTAAAPAPIPGEVVLPARIVSNLFFVQGSIGGSGPFWFLVDTGSSATLVSDRVATLLDDVRMERGMAPVEVISAAGGATLLGSTSIPSLEFGAARFTGLKAAVYDLADLSNHLGLTVDGIIGFPVFNDWLLTLDYPSSVARLTPRFPARAVPGSAVPFAVENGTRPIVNVLLGGQPLTVLVDSGSDLALTLNPAGLDPKFKYGPRRGPIVSTLSGNVPQEIGRLSELLQIGSAEIREPRVMLTDQQSSLGGAILRQFSITFDQKRGLAVFTPAAKNPIRIPSLRSTGLSFIRLTSQWRVIHVLEDAPVATKQIRPGDTLLSIDGELVQLWNLERYEQYLRARKSLTMKLRRGEKTFEVRVPVFDLVP